MIDFKRAIKVSGSTFIVEGVKNLPDKRSVEPYTISAGVALKFSIIVDIKPSRTEGRTSVHWFVLYVLIAVFSTL